ncbi:hypothetical protein WA026_017722 [Henosepilachna vigintioctopunctata]|uniref:MD-2-related lipid-recognition domain-containing protein n=1 Tax=Henosepilachna vigintioctopunctata TaxID=420089 RepID=A0AAW1UBA2_9CUCU
MKLLVVINFMVLAYTVNGKVKIDRIEQCDDHTNYKIKFSSHLKEEGGVQLVGGILKTDMEVGDNVENDVDVYSLENGEYKFLVNVKETWCNVLHNYLGDFGYDMQKSAGISPGTCPLPPGEYSIKDHPLDFSKFKYRDVPKGTLKIKSSMIDLKTKEKVGCTEIEFTISAE